jgi:hypothetical protein
VQPTVNQRGEFPFTPSAIASRVATSMIIN